MNDAAGYPGADTFVRHFGTWNDAVAEAGFDPRLRRRPDEELLADLRAFVERHGEQPTVEAVRDREDMAHPETYAARFGSWNAAVDAAGLSTFDS